VTFTATFVQNSLPGKLTFTTPVRNTPFTNKNVTLGGAMVGILGRRPTSFSSRL